jgi:folate-dependent phosphoribosylglycinamide formyltransferase PurN
MYGNRVHHAVIASGARVSGVTVHFVDAQYDHGAIIAQWPVPVFGSDDAGTLAARVLRVEHILYPRVLDGLAAGRLSPRASAEESAPADSKPAFTLLPREDSRLAENIELSLAR